LSRKILQQPIRSTRWRQPERGETLIHSREQAQKVIHGLEKALAGKKKLTKPDKANTLSARAGLYAAIGDPKMLDAAQDAWAFNHSANTAALVAMSLHHHGRLTEANEFYKRSFDYPHEPGWEIDLSYAQSLMSQGLWQAAWPIVKTLKKRMCYAGYLQNWDGQPTEEVSVISEGGYGDLLHMSRYLPLIADRCKKVTVYLPPFFFEGGFVDLARQQEWYPEIKLLTETPQFTPAIGFFDFPAVFETTPETVPASPYWRPRTVTSRNVIERRHKPLAGICWSARAMETPIVQDGCYRSITDQQLFHLLFNTWENVQWVSLQQKSNFTHPCLIAPELNSWEDTAAIISQLDIVVSVDTAVLHLAACMGKPAWAILSGAIDWKYCLPGDRCVWYPTMRLFKNNAFGFDNAVDATINAINEGSLGRIIFD
jgi:hypothetical protein